MGNCCSDIGEKPYAAAVYKVVPTTPEAKDDEQHQIVHHVVEEAIHHVVEQQEALEMTSKGGLAYPTRA